MKVGFVTDTHRGLRDDESVMELLKDLADAFEEREVDMVIHLGDVAHEAPEESYDARVQEVADVFSEFEFHMTLGNHDVKAMSQSEFETAFDMECNRVLWHDEETSLVAINTAGRAELPDVEDDSTVGYFSDGALSLLQEELSSGRDVVVCTHYPLQYSPYYQEQAFFDVRPEYVFPINKLHFEKMLMVVDENPSLSVFCGHLHPSETVSFTTEPFGIDVSVVQAVQLFEQNEATIDWWDNTWLSTDELVYEF